MKKFSIQRDDGLGNQICNRMLAEVWARDVSNYYRYFHSRANRIAHINFGQEIDTLMQFIENSFLPKSTILKEDESVEKYTTLEKAVGLEIIKSYPMFFERKDFLKYRNHFISTHSKFNLNSSYIALHIRRGDFVRLNEPRLKSDQYYIDMVEKIKSLNKELDVIIETDSPDQVISLAKKIKADINPVSRHCQELINSPSISIPESQLPIWQKLIYTLQAIYNLSSSRWLIPSESGFSNLSYILGDCNTLFSNAIFCRHHTSKQCQRIKTYIQNRESLKNISQWPEEKWGKYSDKLEELVGPLYRIYNFSFLKNNQNFILEEL